MQLCPFRATCPLRCHRQRRTIEGILTAAEVEDTTWGSATAMNLPSITVTPAEMATSLDRVAGAGVSDLLDWEEDSNVRAIVGSWPGKFTTKRAEALGLVADTSFDEVVRSYREGVRPQG